MDTNRMRYFISLARTGSITKSAELHSISAPAFSKAIRVFQEEIGHELTLPIGRGLVLTDYAKSIVPAIESIIQQMDTLKQRADTHLRERGQHLRIATFEVFSTHFMTKTLSEFFPAYRCDLHEAIPGKMEELVATGKADLALTYIPIPHSDLDHLKVQEIEMGIYGKLKITDEADYSAIPFVVPIGPIEGSPNKVRGLDGWPDDAFPRNSFYHVGMLETALGLCREGLAVAYLPKFVVKIHNEMVKREFQLDELPIPKKFSKTKSFVYLVKRKSDVEGTESKRLALAVRKLCR
jgi:DNA-binding transcriptional LysR family regulator